MKGLTFNISVKDPDSQPLQWQSDNGIYFCYGERPAFIDVDRRYFQMIYELWAQHGHGDLCDHECLEKRASIPETQYLLLAQPVRGFTVLRTDIRRRVEAVKEHAESILQYSYAQSGDVLFEEHGLKPEISTVRTPYRQFGLLLAFLLFFLIDTVLLTLLQDVTYIWRWASLGAYLLVSLYMYHFYRARVFRPITIRRDSIEFMGRKYPLKKITRTDVSREGVEYVYRVYRGKKRLLELRFFHEMAVGAMETLTRGIPAQHITVNVS